MRKILAFLLLTLMCVGGWADNVGPFTFTSWVYNSYTRVGGAEGTATYVCNAPIYMEQKGVTITNAGDLTISFQYTSGGRRLELYGVELIGSESSYTAFEHKYAGSNGTPTYTLSNVAAGTYTLRIWSSEYGDGNSYLLGGATNGNITYSGDAANGANLTIISWSKDNWKKSGAAVPTQVSSTIKEKGWRSYEKIHYHDDANLTFSEAKSYNIHFNYTAPDGVGNQRLNIMGVEVLDAEDNHLVAYDYHEGYTGTNFSNRDYRLAILSPGKYTVRILVRMEAYTETPNDVQCQGDITYSVIDGSAIADNYRNNIKPNLYDNGVLKIGAPVQSYLTALETAIEGGNDLTIEAAYNAAMTTNNLNLPSGYYYMKNMDMTSGNKVDATPYAYNDYNLSGNTTHYTLMRAEANVNTAIWKVTNNGATISIVNGDGKGINNGTNYTSLNFGAFKASQFVDWGAKGIYFTQGLHASNQSHLKIGEILRLTDWAHDDSQGSAWEFIRAENSNIFNVVVTGADAYVTYTKDDVSQYAYNGGFFNAESITESEISASDVNGYTKKISIDGNTITVTYVDNSLDMSDSKQYIIKNPAASKYLAANLGAADEAGAEKFLKLATGEKATVAEVEYDCFKLFSVGSLAYVGKASSGENLTTEGAKKFGLVNSATDAVSFIYVGDDIIPVVDGTASTKAWNWHGGADANNPVGLFTTSDSKSNWEFIQNPEWVDARQALQDAITMVSRYTSHIGSGLNKYTYYILDIPQSKEVWDQNISDANAALTNANTSITWLNTLKTTMDNMNQYLRINQPKAGSFIRVRNAGGSNQRMSCVNANNGKPVFANDLNDDKIFYYDGTYLLAYKTGMYVGISANFTTNCTNVNANNGTTFSFPASPIKVGTYNVVFNTNRYLYDDGNAGNDAANSSDTKYTFWLEEVTELPISLTNLSGYGVNGYYATFYSPVPVKISGADAYALTAGDGVLRYNDAAPLSVVPAGIGVILKGTSTTATATITDETADVTSALTGTIATKASTEGEGNYVFSVKNEKLGFYKFAGSQLAGFKAYYNNKGSSSNAFLVTVDEELTSILEALSKAEAAGEYRDLQGNVIANPIKGQIYIKNGQTIKY